MSTDNPLLTPPFPFIAADATTLATSLAPGKDRSKHRILDLACGTGRHGRCYLKHAISVTFVDKDLSHVSDLEDHQHANLLCADLENAPWPLTNQRFTRVIVTNYLWRPILSQILNAVAPGGALLYQTFGIGNEAYGRPSNPDFLLKKGELIEAVGANFTIIESFHGPVQAPKPAVIQRLHAVKNT